MRDAHHIISLLYNSYIASFKTTVEQIEAYYVQLGSHPTSCVFTFFQYK